MIKKDKENTMKSTELKFQIPERELLMVKDLLASLAKTISGDNENKNVTMPNPASSIISYGYKELALEKEAQDTDDFEVEVNGAKAEVVGAWGKIRVPDWVLDSSEYKMVSVTMEMSAIAYQNMLDKIQALYPTVFANEQINKNDFIAALGIAYAHRILTGQVSIQIRATPVTN